MKLILTCEHAGNFIPVQFREIFGAAEDVLTSHRGYDPGALDLFISLRDISWYSDFHMESRLLVEVNRSLHHPRLFSEFTTILSAKEKEKVLQAYYHPYRKRVESQIRKLSRAGEEVLHISVHTFTPFLDGEERKSDIGLLYDPARKHEKELSIRFKNSINRSSPGLRVRFNYPYLGKADGFTTYLRKRFPVGYSGIEVEVNQKFASGDTMAPVIKKALAKAAHEAIADAL